MSDTVNQLTQLIAQRNGATALNKTQASKELGIGITKLDELRKNGEVKFKMVGGSVRISAHTIAEMLA